MNAPASALTATVELAAAAPVETPSVELAAAALVEATSVELAAAAAEVSPALDALCWKTCDYSKTKNTPKAAAGWGFES